jgi:integrase
MVKRRVKRRCTRFRVGRVSVYARHGDWWIYYRDGDKQVRRRVGSTSEEAERVAAELNAQVASSSPTMFSFTRARFQRFARSS